VKLTYMYVSAAGFPGVIAYSSEEENETDFCVLESAYFTQSI